MFNKIKKPIVVQFIPFIKDSVDINIDVKYKEGSVSLLITISLFDKVIFTDTKRVKI